MMPIDEYGDSEITIYRAEFHLLRKIAETSSDLVKGEGWPEFCAAVGGIDTLKMAHRDAVIQWEKWLSD